MKPGSGQIGCTYTGRIGGATRTETTMPTSPLAFACIGGGANRRELPSISEQNRQVKRIRRTFPALAGPVVFPWRNPSPAECASILDGSKTPESCGWLQGKKSPAKTSLISLLFSANTKFPGSVQFFHCTRTGRKITHAHTLC